MKLPHGIFDTGFYSYFKNVVDQKWGPGPLGASKRAWAQKIGADIQVFSQNGPTMLIL